MTKLFYSKVGNCTVTAEDVNDIVDFHNNGYHENVIEKAESFVKEDQLEVLYHELSELIMDLRQKQRLP
jgi:hypothetical protein